MKRHSPVPEGSYGLTGRRPGRWVGLLLAGLITTVVHATPLFLQLEGAGAESKPLSAIAGKKAALVLTLAAPTEIAPQLTGDLSVVTGEMSAPLATALKLQLQPKASAKGGAQQFAFTLDIPVVKSSQRLLLRLRLQPGSGPETFLLPPVWLEAVPSTWKESLQQFTRLVPSGRLAGDERLERLFTEAEVEVAETPAAGPVPKGPARIWFVVPPDGEFVLPSAPAGVLWVVFKPDVGETCRVQRFVSGGPLAVVVDVRALQAPAGDDAVAQAVLEQALETIRALAGADSLP